MFGCSNVAMRVTSCANRKAVVLDRITPRYTMAMSLSYACWPIFTMAMGMSYAGWPISTSCDCDCDCPDPSTRSTHVQDLDRHCLAIEGAEMHLAERAFIEPLP